MAINEYKTRTGVELVAEGTLNGIFFNELKEKKDYGKNGKSWIPTHSVNIIVDEDRIGLGLTDKDVIRCKDVDGNYHDLQRGQKISIVVTPSGEYKGVQQYGGRANDVIIMEQAPAGSGSSQQAPGGQQKGYTASKKDMSGVHTGHAVNVAMNVLGDVSDADEIIRVAKEAHTLTQRLKKEYADKNPDMSEYDVGASVGQAVLSASHYVEDVADIEEIARQTLDVVVPAVLEFVKASGEEKKPAVVKKTAAKKTTAKKTAKKAPVVDDDSPQVDDSDIPESSFEDMDDDIPF